jgi:hypothetical protein
VSKPGLLLGNEGMYMSFETDEMYIDFIFREAAALLMG